MEKKENANTSMPGRHNPTDNDQNPTSVSEMVAREDLFKELTETTKAIAKRHGDISKGSLLESGLMKNSVSIGICKAVHKLQQIELKGIVEDVGALDVFYEIVRDAEKLKFNVGWLRDQLDGIKEAAQLTQTKKRRLENLDRKKKCVDKLQSEIAREFVMVEELDHTIAARLSRFSEFKTNF